ncbi:MAG: PASTA domain-containing protein [Sedimentisphaerales bacterium]|nr:PASTA domain-containing protein [Sedimentisphaerales bacterium]
MEAFLRVLIIAAVMVCSVNGFAYSGGDGSAEFPYQIANVDDFMQLSGTPTDWSNSFVLTANINLSGRTFTQAPIAPTFSSVFMGTFEGDNHTISNLKINAPNQDYIGLFGNVSSGGKIYNIKLDGVDIQGRNYVGGLVGDNQYGRITSSYVSGSVAGISFVGGMVGNQYRGALTSCYASGIVSGTENNVGGLAGKNESGTFTCCHAAGSATGSDYVGGLIGWNYGKIQFCYATVNVGGISPVGGLIGYIHESMVSYCYATGTVNGSGGGLIGSVDYLSTVFSCYATGSVIGYGGPIGGLVGDNSGIIMSCYAIGEVDVIDGDAGGLVGINHDGNVRDSFWDTESSGCITSAGGTGKTTEQMKTLQTFLDAGWLFLQQDKLVADWIMPVNDYPKLTSEVYMPVTIPNLKGLTEQQAKDALDAVGLVNGQTYSVYDVSVEMGIVSETFPKSGITVYAGLTPVHVLLAKGTKYGGGNGYLSNPYKIVSIEHLLDMVNVPADWNKAFVLASDINLKGLPFMQSPIAPDISASSGFSGTPFTGTFDGNGHAVLNLTISEPSKDFVGFFGYAENNYKIKNTSIKNVYIKGRDNVGGLIGQAWWPGMISSCYVNGVVNGSQYAGGLAGFNGGEMTSCISNTIVGGSYYIGGLIGYNEWAITSCCAHGIANGYSFVGGLVGHNYQGKLIVCYSTASITGSAYVGGLCGYKTTGGNYQDTGNFWDTETSGIVTSAMGTGKMTAEMKTLSTFVDAGWDFTNETANGSNDTWRMCVDGVDTPRLNWESMTGDFSCPDGVAMEDLDYFAIRWLMEGCAEAGDCDGADLDGDGAVDLADWAVFAGRWLEGV